MPSEIETGKKSKVCSVTTIFSSGANADRYLRGKNSSNWKPCLKTLLRFHLFINPRFAAAPELPPTATRSLR